MKRRTTLDRLFDQHSGFAGDLDEEVQVVTRSNLRRLLKRLGSNTATQNQASDTPSEPVAASLGLKSPIGATWRRDLEAWIIYHGEPLGNQQGYTPIARCDGWESRSLVDAILEFLRGSTPAAPQPDRESVLREACRETLRALTCGQAAIVDTVWVAEERNETLFDCVAASLDEPDFSEGLIERASRPTPDTQSDAVREKAS